MPRIRLFVKGEGGDHELRSPKMEEKQIQEEFSLIDDAIRTGNLLQLPWVRVEGVNIVAAHRMPTE